MSFFAHVANPEINKPHIYVAVKFTQCSHRYYSICKTEIGISHDDLLSAQVYHVLSFCS